MPYLDHRLVEFGLSLPDDLKVRGRQGKVFLKRWGERYLSPKLLWRKKRGFSVPMAQVLDEDFVTALARLLPRTRGLRAYFNPGAVQGPARASVARARRIESGLVDPGICLVGADFPGTRGTPPRP